MSVESGSLLAINHLSYGVDCMLPERVATAGTLCAPVPLPLTGIQDGRPAGRRLCWICDAGKIEVAALCGHSSCIHSQPDGRLRPYLSANSRFALEEKEHYACEPDDTQYRHHRPR